MKSFFVLVASLVGFSSVSLAGMYCESMNAGGIYKAEVNDNETEMTVTTPSGYSKTLNVHRKDNYVKQTEQERKSKKKREYTGYDLIHDRPGTNGTKIDYLSNIAGTKYYLTFEGAVKDMNCKKTEPTAIAQPKGNAKGKVQGQAK